jgi:teichuronic acid biosynthesis glycosyltransferase TuaG
MNISIVMTTYNAATYVIETLQSILNQTYQNFEIVIVDDGSNDNTLKIINDFVSQYPEFKINVHSVGHIGRAAALNLGITFAQFDWIAIIDADDLWNKHKLAWQIQYATEKQLDFLGTQSKMFYKNSDVNLDENIKAIGSRATQITLDKMLYFNIISHSSILVKKHLVKYDVNRKSQIDYEMFLRLLQQGVNIYLLNDCLVCHRIHSGQSFEARKPLRYALKATGLQLQYCLLHLKWRQTFFVLLKLGYYLLPRKMRFKLRGLTGR